MNGFLQSAWIPTWESKDLAELPHRSLAFLGSEPREPPIHNLEKPPIGTLGHARVPATLIHAVNPSSPAGSVTCRFRSIQTTSACRWSSWGRQVHHSGV